jgi:hypothetical protein
MASLNIAIKVCLALFFIPFPIAVNFLKHVFVQKLSVAGWR